MESISYVAPQGLHFTSKCYVMGAHQRPTKKHTDENPSYWFQVELAGSTDGASVGFFADEQLAKQAAAELAKAKGPVLATATIEVEKRGRETSLRIATLSY